MGTRDREVGLLSETLTGARIDSDTTTLSFLGQKHKIETASDARIITDGILETGDLRTLELVGNTLSVEGAEAVGRALSNKPDLKRALFSDLFTGRMKGEIPRALDHLMNGIMRAGAGLVELDLSDNALSPAGAEAITPFLSSPSASHLRVLKLNNDGLGPTGGQKIAEGLSGCDPLMRLRVFESGRGRLESEGIKALAQVFQRMGSLEEVSVPQNGIYPDGIEALCLSLEKNPHLRVLNLQDNTVNPEGARSVANMIQKLKDLQVLNLNDCLLKENGTSRVVKAIRRSQPPNLHTLQLEGNEIGGKGGFFVIDQLDRIPSIKHLSLSGNRFGNRLPYIMGMKGKYVEQIEVNESDDGGSLDSEERTSDWDELEEEEDEGQPPQDEESEWSDRLKLGGGEGETSTSFPPAQRPLGPDGDEGVENGYHTAPGPQGMMTRHLTGAEIKDRDEWDEENWWVDVWRREMSHRLALREQEKENIVRPLRLSGADAAMVARDFMKVAGVIERTNESRTMAPYRGLCDWMMKDALSLVRGEKAVARLRMDIVNYLMSGAGFIKEEEGERGVRRSASYGFLRALEHVVAQPYMGKEEKNVILFALQRVPEACFGVEDAAADLKNALSA